MCLQAFVPSGNSREESVFLPFFQFLEIVHFPWLVTPFFLPSKPACIIFKFPFDLPASLSYKDPCDYIGPTQPNPGKFPNFGIFRHIYKIPFAMLSNIFTTSRDQNVDIFTGKAYRGCENCFYSVTFRSSWHAGSQLLQWWSPFVMTWVSPLVFLDYTELGEH